MTLSYVNLTPCLEKILEGGKECIRYILNLWLENQSSIFSTSVFKVRLISPEKKLSDPFNIPLLSMRELMGFGNLSVLSAQLNMLSDRRTIVKSLLIRNRRGLKAGREDIWTRSHDITFREASALRVGMGECLRDCQPVVETLSLFSFTSGGIFAIAKRVAERGERGKNSRRCQFATIISAEEGGTAPLDCQQTRRRSLEALVARWCVQTKKSMGVESVRHTRNDLGAGR